MIRISFAEPATDEWQQWRRDCDERQALHNAAVEAGEAPAADPALYGRLKGAVFAARNGPFSGKCVFCEARIRSSQYGDIEHFRPKGAIHGDDNRPITRAGSEDRHPGYYWLAYDWRNLLPSCVLCNRPSTEPGERPVGKRNYFPLVDEETRAQSPGEEALEEPLLIHPVSDRPEEHLGVDATGVMFAIDDCPRADACIRILGLNLRELPGERRLVYEDAKKLYKGFFVNRLNAPDSEEVVRDRERLEAIQEGDEEFTAAARLGIADAKNDIMKIIEDEE